MNKDKKKKRDMPRYKRLLRYQCWELSKGLKLRERIGHANQWCLSHPRKFMGIVLGLSSLIIIYTLISVVVSFSVPQEGSQQDESFMTDKVESIQPTLDGMRKIDDTKKVVNIELKRLTDKGLQIKNELDSLLALENKSHEDSVRIVSDYRQLKDIVNFLNKEKK